MNLSSLGGNWVDLVIILVLIFFISRAIRFGFWVLLADFISFSISLIAALQTYKFVSEFLKTNFSLSRSLANALSFLFTAIVIEAILGVLLYRLAVKLPDRLHKSWWSKLLALVPAAGEALIFVAFISTLVVAFPFSSKIKANVTESKIGGLLVEKTVGLEKSINEIFGGAIEDSLTFLTVRPGSREAIPLTVDRRGFVVNEVAETEMFRLVNEERVKQGIKKLVWEPEVVPAARAHARDMWERLYFGHVSPDGEDVGDRLDEVGIKYVFAGENLALAPAVSIAHAGLMNSEGHRENILDKKFEKIGIGVVENGVYGKTFVQVFTD